jgi:DNA polymerase family A
MSLASDGWEELVAGADLPRVAAQRLDHPMVLHNAAFDMACLAAEWPELLPDIFRAYDEDRIEDSMIRAKLLDVAKGHYRGWFHKEKISYGLGDPERGGIGLVRRCFGEKLDKTSYRLDYHKLDGVPLSEWPRGAVEYALDDARWTLRLWELQEEYKDLLEDQHRQARAAFWLRLMSCWGLVTDPAAVDAFERLKTGERDSLARTLAEHGLVELQRDGSWKRCLAPARLRLATAFADQGRPAPLTEKGAIALDDASCRNSGNALMVAYADFSSAVKSLSTDLPLLRSGTEHPIHARFEELLETGRTSSSPNVQNPPREGGVRECFVPRPGFVFASADYSMLELRTVAQVLYSRFGRSALRDALNAGRDPHTEVACRILGIPYDEGARLHEQEEHDFENTRAVGKVCNFGFPGGLGPTRLVHFAKLSYGVDLTEGQARGLKAKWLEQWPEFRHYFAWIAGEVERLEPRVRQLFSNRWRGGVTFTEACNGFFQGLGADAAKAAGWVIAKACYLRGSCLFGSRIVNFVHDEFLLEVPEEIGSACAEELARLMQEGAQPWTPDVAMVVGKPKLARRWSKDAKAVRKDGRLVPWEG